MTTGPGPQATSGIQYLIGTTADDATADTYVLVGSLEQIPEYGPQNRDITFEDITQGTVLHFTGAQDDGNVTISVGMDLSDDGQLALLDANSSVNRKFDYNHKIVYNDARPAKSSAVTISVASPGVVTWTAHGLKAGTKVVLTTTDALPTGLTADTTYYVKTVLSADTFTLTATKGGSVINTSSTQSGTHTGTTDPTSTSDVFKAKVQSFRRNPGNLGSVVKASVQLGLKSGTMELTPRLP